MIINPTTAIANGAGETITINIESNPTEVSVLQKPSRGEVRIRNVESSAILPRQTIGSSNIGVNQVITNVATISVRANNSSSQRSGIVRFGNGSVTKDFTIRQLGYRTILFHFGDDIIHIESGSGTWNLRSSKEIDPKSVKITRGSVSKTNDNIIDNLQINFTPQLYSDSELTETCTGGQITFKTLDGETVVANYNYGSWLKNYNLTIGPFEGGKITVDGVEYNSTYFESLTDGTTVSLNATPNEGSTFTGWSDGVETATRTITINGADVEIYPIFESDYYLYDNSKIVEFDNSDLVKI